MSDNTTPAKPAPKWVELCKVSDLPAQGGKYVAIENKSLAVFKLTDGEISVIDDACPHAGGSLSGGWVSSDCVFCPWHNWPFKLKDGECRDNTNIKVDKYPAKVVDGVVHAEV